MQGTVISIEVEAGALLSRGQTLLVMESMKMQHAIESPISGTLHELRVSEGDTVFDGVPSTRLRV